MEQAERRGRPGPKPIDPSLRHRAVNLSLPPRVARALDALAAERGAKRSTVAVEVIEAGLAALEIARRIGGGAA
jgi:hypothetical protein